MGPESAALVRQSFNLDALLIQPMLHALPDWQMSISMNGYRYRGSLQLLDGEKLGGSRSLPQIFLPARFGLLWN